MEFVDRLLTCADCGGEFVFTAGEQLFFLDKQFKNDPKRCKPCKSRRSSQAAGATPGSPAAAGISRTETRTECSECGITTTSRPRAAPYCVVSASKTSGHPLWRPPPKPFRRLQLLPRRSSQLRRPWCPHRLPPQVQLRWLSRHMLRRLNSQA
jgi:hypothetical protein